MRVGFALAVVACVVAACASQGTQRLQTQDPRVCAQNFTFDGSFLAGRTFKTFEVVSGVSKKAAFERVLKYTIQDGWQITSTDKDLGIVSASQTVSYGEGKTAPLNISVDSAAGGVKISMSFSTSGGVTAPVNGVKDHFCKTIEAARQG